jgi:hypothetical protein
MTALGWIIVILLIMIATAEFFGIARKDDGKIDTITEVYRKMRDSLPTPVKFTFMLLITGLLFWTILHFWDLV